MSRRSFPPTIWYLWPLSIWRFKFLFSSESILLLFLHMPLYFFLLKESFLNFCRICVILHCAGSILQLYFPSTSLFSYVSLNILITFKLVIFLLLLTLFLWVLVTLFAEFVVFLCDAGFYWIFVHIFVFAISCLQLYGFFFPVYYSLPLISAE